MRITIVDGPGAPSEGEVLVTDGAIWVAGKPHCPLDDLAGVVIVDATNGEQHLLAKADSICPGRPKGNK